MGGDETLSLAMNDRINKVVIYYFLLKGNPLNGHVPISLHNTLGGTAVKKTQLKGVDANVEKLKDSWTVNQASTLLRSRTQ